jgi:hypothetical protein
MGRHVDVSMVGGLMVGEAEQCIHFRISGDGIQVKS